MEAGIQISWNKLPQSTSKQELQWSHWENKMVCMERTDGQSMEMGMKVGWDNENTKIPVSRKVENAKLQCNLEKWISMRTFNAPGP